MFNSCYYVVNIYRKQVYDYSFTVVSIAPSVTVFELLYWINIKNFGRSLTTVVRAQNNTFKTANITDAICNRKR